MQAHILVAEDDEDTREVVQLFLRPDGLFSICRMAESLFENVCL